MGQHSAARWALVPRAAALGCRVPPLRGEETQPTECPTLMEFVRLTFWCPINFKVSGWADQRFHMHPAPRLFRS